LFEISRETESKIIFKISLLENLQFCLFYLFFGFESTLLARQVQQERAQMEAQ